MANNYKIVKPRTARNQIMVDDIKKYKEYAKKINTTIDDLLYEALGYGRKYNNVANPPSNIVKKPNNVTVYNNKYNEMLNKAKLNTKTINDLFGKGYTETQATNKFNNTIRPNMTKGMHTAEGLAKAGKYANTIKEGLKLAPIIGGGWDTYSGINKIVNGKPIIGTGQALFGLGELGFDIGGALLAPITGGGSTAGETSARIATRAALREAYKRALKAGATKEGALMYAKLAATPNALKQKAIQGIKGAGDFLQSAPGNILATAAFEIPSFIEDRISGKPTFLGRLFSDDDNKQQTPPVPDKSGSNPTDPNKANGDSGNNPNGNGGYGGYGGGYNPNALLGSDDTSDALTNDIVKATSDGGVTNPNSNEIAKTQTEGEVGITPNAYDVLDEWRKKQEFYDAYRNSLINYRNNYGNLYEQTYARNKALEGMRDFGNPSAGTYTSSMSPLDLASNEVALDKTIADEMVKPYDDYKELIGNIALSKQIGLPPEVMYTDSKRFDSATDYMRAKDTAQLNNITKQYIADQKKATKLVELQLDREIARAKIEGDWRKAQYLGGLKYQMNLQDNAAGIQKSLINTAPWYTDMQTLMETLSALGIKPQPQQVQQVQPTNQQTVRANASVQATPGNKDAILGEKFAKYSGR